MTNRSSDKASLTIVTPVFNEAEVLPLFWDQLRRVLDDLVDYDWSVIFVVDPSGDATEEVVRDITTDPRARAIFMARRAGHQMSLVAGMDHATSDVCVMMDSDLQHPPSLIPDLVALYEGGADIVQTVRVDTDGVGGLRKVTSSAFYRVINRVSDVDLVESGADFRLVSRRVADVLRNEIREQNQFLRGLVQWIGFPTATLPFSAPARPAGRSKYSMHQSMRLAASGLVSFSKMPLQLGLVLGLFVALLAFLFALVVLFGYLSGAEVPAGWSSLAFLVASLSSIQLISLGLVGLYVGSIFDEVKKRPPYVIRESLDASRSASGEVANLGDS